MPENEPFFDHSPDWERARIEHEARSRRRAKIDAAWDRFFGAVRIINAVLICAAGIGTAVYLIVVITVKLGLLE